MDEKQIDKIVDRFLCWKLPDDFNPDGRISFNPEPDAIGNKPEWPVGTNLFTAIQAREMIVHILANIEDDVEKEQGRWQDEIYQMLIERTGDDTIDGGGCDSGDPLDVTMAEIGQAIMCFEEKQTDWRDVAVSKAPHGIPVWCWNEDWEDEDFNPEGIRDGFWNDEGYWTTCGWDPCQDVYTTDEESVPQKWALKIHP